MLRWNMNRSVHNEAPYSQNVCYEICYQMAASYKQYTTEVTNKYIANTNY